MDIKGKIALITGASSGIGEAAARLFAAQGALPILVARRSDELKRVQSAIRTQTGVDSIIIPADVTRASDRQKIASAAEQYGISLLIHSAGITAHGKFEHTKPEVLEKTMEINFFSPVYLTQSLLPAMRRAPGRRKIVLISTPSALHGIPHRFAYSASKAAGHAWMESIRVELHRENFDTLLFCPGYTRTALRSSGLAADGSILSEPQAKKARDPDDVAARLLAAIRKDKRIAFTSNAGPLLYYLRTLAPGLLEKRLRKELESS